LGYTFIQIIFNDTHIYLRLVKLLKACSSITDMLLFCSSLLIVNKCLYWNNGLLLYFNDTYLIILNGVTSANSLNYFWYVCVFDKYLWIIVLLIYLSLFWIIFELRYSLNALNITLCLIYLIQTVHDCGKTSCQVLKGLIEGTIFVDLCLSFVLRTFCCPSVFDLWIMITSLVSSNSSYISKVRNSSLRHRRL
jgi:hypothetical protein